MPPRSTSPPLEEYDDAKALEELQGLLGELALDPEKEQVVSEIEVLQSIYGDDAIRLFKPTPDPQTIRYQITLSLPPPHDAARLKVLVTLPPAYPSSAPPQLQLLSKYLGAFGVDAGLFGDVLKTYMSVGGVQWVEGQECVFDGLQSVVERCVGWYEERLSLERVGQLVREEERELVGNPGHEKDRDAGGGGGSTSKEQVEEEETVEMPPGIVLHVGEAIHDRKSTFVGRACRISHPSQVPQILSYLMSDKKIARAAHPIINAWRCQVGNLLHQDNDDDGETAAGGRIAHLLQILEVNNVLVVVTRYFGGIHLGPDRFKHINQAARNALDVGGFLDTPDASSGGGGKKNAGRGKKHG